MHERYAHEGLVCMSLSVDQAFDKQRTLGFLQVQRARFANYFLQNVPGGADPWNVDAVPLIVVYDRTGRLAARFEEPYSVELFVRKLLAQQT